MSSGVTSCFSPPSVIAGFEETGVRMAIRSASTGTGLVPTRGPTAAQSGLSDSLSAPGRALRARLQADRREDRVVGRRQRAGERVRPRVAVLEVVDDELVVAAGHVEGPLARGPHGRGADAAAQRLGEDERLDGRAGL